MIYNFVVEKFFISNYLESYLKYCFNFIDLEIYNLKI
jgi:hypothetical protein